MLLGFITYLNAQVKSINTAELEKLIKVRIKIIDIRAPKELNKTGIIPTSYRLNFYTKEGKINRNKWLNAFNRLVKDRYIKFVLISRDGKKAKHAATLLHDLKGYKKPHYLKGGINSWILEQKKIIYIK